MQICCDDVIEALQSYVMGKDTIGVDHYVYFNPDNGDFFQRMVANGKPVESVGKDCIEIYNNKDYHGRFTRNGYIHHRLRQNGVRILESLWDNGKLTERIYQQLQKMDNEDRATWLTLHQLNDCSGYIQPHDMMEDELHDIAQQICWKLDERGVIQ